jgi:DNA-directed RNA polymerase specialized sigma24 family protein
VSEGLNRDNVPARSPATPGTASTVPTHWENFLENSVLDRIYPRHLFPPQWFPDLEGIIKKLFAERWQSDEAFRDGLSGASEASASDMISAALALPALLAGHPHALVMIYRQMITGFIRRLHRREDERPDIVQEVFARLLSGKLARIKDRFDAHFGPRPSFTSYFMVCIRNIYIDIVREGMNLPMKRSDVPLAVLEADFPAPVRQSPSPFLDEEFAKLEAILRLHPASRNRIVLCLKLKCRLPVSAGDVRRCFPGCSASDIMELGADFRKRRDRELFRVMAAVFNRHEARPVRADTLRKWVEGKTHLIMAHLNRLHGRDIYDGDNIHDLLSLFFAEGGNP